MIDAEDNIKLIDFGIAADCASRRQETAKSPQTMGTPDYISPEQVNGKHADTRSDIYALGVMLYEMVTGKVPFEGPNAFAIMNDRLVNNPVPPCEIEPSVSPQLQEIIYRALERDFKNRYATAREIAWELGHQDQVRVEPRIELREWKQRRTPWGKKVLSLVMLALIPVVVFALLVYLAHHA
jgi:serine/threonine-protein kinase